MSITQISKIQVKTGNISDLPQLDVGEFGWAVDDRKLYIGNDPSIIPAPPPPTPNNTEILTILSPLAGGSNTEVQYNKDGDLAGDPKFTFNDVTGNIDLQGNIIPQISNVFHLGVDDKRWKDLYLNDFIAINAATIQGFANAWIEVPNINVVSNTHTSNLYVSGIADIPNLIVGNIVINGEVTINGDSIDTTANTFSLVNANATTIYFGGDANLLSIGSATGTTTINNNLNVGLDINVVGGDITTTAAIATLFNANAAVIDIGGDATVIDIGASTGQTTVNHDLNVLGNAVVHGNMSILGNLTYVNAESLSIEDPIITIGGGPNGSPLTGNDGKDRGVYMHYYTTEPVDAFMGWDNSNAEFALGSNVTFTGANSEIIFFNELGNLRLNEVKSFAVTSTFGNITEIYSSNITGFDLDITGQGNIVLLTTDQHTSNLINTVNLGVSNNAITNSLSWSNAYGFYGYIDLIYNLGFYGANGVFTGNLSADNMTVLTNSTVGVKLTTQDLQSTALSTLFDVIIGNVLSGNIISANSLTLSNNALILGNVSTNNITVFNDAFIGSDAYVAGNAYITQDAYLYSNAYVTKNLTANASITGNLIFEGLGANVYPVITLVDIGIGQGQIPLNSYLGDLAYQTSDFAKLGNLTINDNLYLTNLSNIITTSSTFSLINANATTVNFAGAATVLEIASASGNTNINNNLIVDGNVSIVSGNLTTTSTTFNLVNSTATTVNFAGAATSVEIASSSGTTNVNNNLIVDGNLSVNGGNLTTTTTTFSLINANATTVNFAGAATSVEIASSSGTTNINNNLIVDLNTTVLGNLILTKTITTAGTTGNITINKQAGSVNFAASASNLWVTNNLVDANSVVLATVASNDATMKSVSAVSSTGQFILYPDAVPTAETRVNWLVIN